MSKREDYQTQMEENLALWSARFEALKTRAGKDASPDIKKQLEVWSASNDAALAKLAELKATTGDKWDVVKEEMEKSWHAIEVVLNEQRGGPASQAFSREELQALSTEQQDAVLEALVVAIAANTKTNRDEVALFNAEMGKIPWVQPREAIMEKATQARLVAMRSDADRAALLKGIAARLPRGPISEKTLGMMAMMMAADKMATAKIADAYEKSTLGAFAAAFGIPPDRLSVIAASLRGA